MASVEARRATTRSEELFAAAQRVIPGGVNSPVRAFRHVGGTPRFIARGSGARIVDADGNEYIDYVMSWGALPLGHAHPAVVDAISRQASLGTSYGAPTEMETELAELIARLMPAVEMVRFVSSGTEAVMSAIRLARAVTSRQIVLKFDGCYHGHADGMLVAAGSGVATLGLPDSPGVTPGAAATTISIPFNDVAALQWVFAEKGKQIAAAVVEPVAGNMGLVLPTEGFLPELRRLTAEHGAMLIFDEVMTGARVSRGGAQELYGIRPDLTCLGKVIGGGLPAAAYGGSRDVMRSVAPVGPVYQAGTLSGNPLAMAAGIATLRQLQAPGSYETLGAASNRLAAALSAACERHGLAVQTASAGGMWGFFFTPGSVRDFKGALESNTALFRRFFHACLERGVYLPPSPFEACFVSTAHDAEVLDRTADVFEEAVKTTRGTGPGA